jgi:hypothetical protein
MAVVWKTEIEITAIQEIEFPVGAELLCVNNQDEKLCVWFKCNPKIDEKEYRTIIIAGTGHKTVDDTKYIGTVLMRGGTLVCHVFDAGKADSRMRLNQD